MTKVLYDYRRRQLLKEFARRTAPEAIRIARAGGVPATANIARRAQHLNRLSKMATHGGILLTGVGLYAGCMQIGSAKTQEEKNEIFVETVTSSLAGAAAGYGVGLFLVSNPVGWGISLILVVSAVAASYGTGKGFRLVYDNYLHSIDFVCASGTGHLCG